MPNISISFQPNEAGAGAPSLAINEQGNAFVVWTDSRFSPWGEFGLDIFGSYGTEITVDVKADSVVNVISDWELFLNSPNPFNSTTQIRFRKPSHCNDKIEVNVYNILGIKVKRLVSGNVAEGVNLLTWDGTDERGTMLPSGIYFYTLRAGDITISRKMLIVR